MCKYHVATKLENIFKLLNVDIFFQANDYFDDDYNDQPDLTLNSLHEVSGQLDRTKQIKNVKRRSMKMTSLILHSQPQPQTYQAKACGST